MDYTCLTWNLYWWPVHHKFKLGLKTVFTVEICLNNFFVCNYLKLLFIFVISGCCIATCNQLIIQKSFILRNWHANSLYEFLCPEDYIVTKSIHTDIINSLLLVGMPVPGPTPSYSPYPGGNLPYPMTGGGSSTNIQPSHYPPSTFPNQNFGGYPPPYPAQQTAFSGSQSGQPAPYPASYPYGTNPQPPYPPATTYSGSPPLGNHFTLGFSVYCRQVKFYEYNDVIYEVSNA